MLGEGKVCRCCQRCDWGCAREADGRVHRRALRCGRELFLGGAFGVSEGRIRRVSDMSCPTCLAVPVRSIYLVQSPQNVRAYARRRCRVRKRLLLVCPRSHWQSQQCSELACHYAPERRVRRWSSGRSGTISSCVLFAFSVSGNLNIFPNHRVESTSFSEHHGFGRYLCLSVARWQGSEMISTRQLNSCIHAQNLSSPSLSKEEELVTSTRRSTLIVNHWNITHLATPNNPSH